MFYLELLFFGVCSLFVFGVCSLFYGFNLFGVCSLFCQYLLELLSLVFPLFRRWVASGCLRSLRSPGQTPWAKWLVAEEGAVRGVAQPEGAALHEGEVRKLHQAVQHLRLLVGFDVLTLGLGSKKKRVLAVKWLDLTLGLGSNNNKF